MTPLSNQRPSGKVEPLTPDEARERHFALVQYDQLGLKLNKPSKTLVYHYTNLAGFRGIVMGKSVWASDYRYLNDRSEFLFGLEILEMVIAVGEASDILGRELRQELLQEIALMKRSNVYMYVLCASFCQKGNVLSQWRAYGRSDGIAIGFDRSHLQVKAAEQGFVCGPIQYYWSKQSKLSEWLADRCKLLAARNVTLPVEESELDRELRLNLHEAHVRKMLVQWIAETAAMIKHPAFEEEHEWRCVRVISDKDFRTSAAVKDRSSGTKIIPYVDLNLEGQEQGIGVRSVVIGPTSDPLAVEHAVLHMTSQMAFGDLLISHPFNPLKV